MRIAIGGICHETSTFALQPTTVADFEQGFGLYRGREMIDRFRDTNTCTGGFIAAAEQHDFETVPILWGFAYPGGLIRREDYETLKAEFLDRLRQAISDQGAFDGVLLDQHGAMVVEGIDEADGDFMAAVREAVGPDVPVIATTDLHANHGQQRVAAADAIIGFDTYPHIDMAERGREAGELIVRTLRGEVRPVTVLHPLPLFWGTPCQVTGQPPMDEAIRQVHALEERPGILSVTLATGFPWADVPHVGSSVLVVADGDESLAEQTARELGDWVWERRRQWYQPPRSVRDALAEGEQQGRYPIVLADHADNTGGGAPGDSTEILQTFIDLGLSDALLLYMADPEVARAAHDAGVGACRRWALGGKSSPRQGAPVEAEFEVMALSQGDFVYDGPMFAGLSGNMGTSAWLRTGGVHVVVVTAREQPLGPAFARTLGIEVEEMRYIALKSAAHFRASFEPLAGSIHSVDARAIHTHDFSQLQYAKRTRKMFPVESD